MKRLRIGVDMDGILVDMLPSWLENLNFGYGLDITIEDVTQWDMHKIDKCKHLSPKNVYEAFDYERFWTELLPMPGAIEAFKFLNENHDVFIVTAVPGGVAASGKIRWLQKHLPFFNISNLFICKNKVMVGPFDIFIDDKASTLMKFEELCTTKTISIEYPYNKHAMYSISFKAGSYKDPELAWKSIVNYVQLEALK